MPNTNNERHDKNIILLENCFVNYGGILTCLYVQPKKEIHPVVSFREFVIHTWISKL